MTAVIDEVVRRPKKVSVWIHTKRRDQVFEVAVVTDIDGSPWMHQISDKEIQIEVLGSACTGEKRVPQHGVVLRNQPERKVAANLVIPIRPDDVIVEHRSARRAITQAKPQVAIVDLHRTVRPNR